jgi:methylmalonyl-CoA mutase N-terminal domain/subunit
VDPLAGSYYVEHLTDRLEAEARELLAEVDDRGGMLRAVEDQWVQRQIQESAYDRQQEIEARERTIVGVNAFETDDEPEIDIQEVTEEQAAAQRRRVRSVSDDRDDDAVEAALDDLATAAAGDANLMPPIIAAVKTYATVGEICDVLREEFGTYAPGTSV